MGSLLLFLLSSLFIHSANSSSSSSRCIESEWRALMEFRGSLVNDASKLSSWTGRDCCSNWLGITCHNSTGHVQKVDLEGYYNFHGYTESLNLSSPLSPWLFNLSRLESLTIFASGLQGPIPNMFEKLTSLAHLDLSNNHFDSPFPDSLCSLTSLTELDIRYSQLKGPLPPCLGNMTSLTNMDLGENDLSGKIPSELGYLTNLIELVLSGNSLNSSIPSTLGHLSNLESLGLGSNHLSGKIPLVLGHLSNLEYLGLGNNQLSGKIPLVLGHLSKLESLDLGSNHLMGELSESFFEGLDSLKSLDMSGNKRIVLNLSSQWIPPFQMTWIDMGSAFVGPEFPPWIQTQRNLEVLYMSNANISGVIPEWCQTAFPNLTWIDLSNNFFTGSLPTFDSSPSLEYLQLSGNQLSGNIPWELCNLPSLWYLYLGNNQLTGTIPSCLGSLHNLFVLDLGFNNLYGHIPGSLLKLELLTVLDLGENELQGSIPQWIGIRWPLLQYMRLESNNLSGDIPVNLCQLPNLQILNLALNNFVGTIPSCLGNSSMTSESSNDDFEYFPSNSSWTMSMVSISSNALLNNIKGREILCTWKVLKFARSLLLSSNHLHGEIPVELMNLKGLQSLDLSNNELTGTIPEAINNLTNLESLDLSANQLSGNIPQTLAEIDSLSYLNLSFNKLGGRIPSGKHFDTLHDSSFYQGNKGLCGDQPLMKSCPSDHSAISNEPSGAHVSDGNDEFDRWLAWVYAGIGPGFAVGFLGVICTLFFKDGWRIAFFGFTDDVYNKVWVTFAIKISQFRSNFN